MPTFHSTKPAEMAVEARLTAPSWSRQHPANSERFNGLVRDRSESFRFLNAG